MNHDSFCAFVHFWDVTLRNGALSRTREGAIAQIHEHKQFFLKRTMDDLGRAIRYAIVRSIR